MGDIRVTDGQDPPLTELEKRKKRKRIIATILMVLLVTFVLGLIIRMDRYVLTQGYVTTSDYAEVRPTVAGKVARKLVSSGDMVTTGDLLVQLDASAEEATLAEARTTVERQASALSRRQAEIAEIKRRHANELAQAEIVLEDLQQTAARIQLALDNKDNQGAVSDTSVELASLIAARHQARKAKVDLARREAEIAQARRQLNWSVEEAKLMLKNAESSQDRMAQMVESQLAPGTSLEEAKLKAEVAALKLKELQQRDPKLFDQELEAMRQELQAKEDDVRQAEARLRDRLRESQLKIRLQALRVDDLTQTNMNVYDKEIAELEQTLRGANEAVARAEASVRDREIRAPISGQIVRYEFSEGELVQPASVLMEIYGGETQVLKLRVSERYATRVGPGQRYIAELASYSGLRSEEFEGKVMIMRNIIQQDAGKTYRVAYCDFDPRGLNVPPGTSAEARIYYGRTSFWLYLFGLD